MSPLRALRRLALPAALAALAASAATPAAAQTVTIGSSAALGSNSINNGPFDPSYIGQTFTVPQVSNILAGFTLRTYGNSATTFEIYAYQGSVLVGAPLFSAALEQGIGTQQQQFSFGSGLQLTSGALYAAVVRVGANEYSAVSWSGNTNPYDGGDFVTCFVGQATCSTSPVDATFSATFVSERVTPTPEPATVALLGGGLLALGGAGAVRRRARA